MVTRRFSTFSSDEVLDIAKIAVAQDDHETVAACLKELEDYRKRGLAKSHALSIRKLMASRSGGTPPNSKQIELDVFQAIPVGMHPINGKSRDNTNRFQHSRSNKENPGNFPPTAEQKRAIDAFLSGRNVKINAFAGSGKTSTLVQIAHRTTRQGLYLAFNKKIVDDSAGVFPRNVRCKTIHGLAYQTMIGTYKSNAKMTGKINDHKVAMLLRLKDWDVFEGHVLTAVSQGQLILATVYKYCRSAVQSIEIKHVPRIRQLEGLTDKTRNEVATWIVKAAEILWGLMKDPQNDVPVGHEGYLKLWALQKPEIAADFLMVDEAQDTNPVVLGVLLNQKAQIVIVGDKHQQIYEWLGAVNAMDKFPNSINTNRTLSFRFGSEIAKLANAALRLLGETVSIVGNSDRKSVVGPINRPDVILARTNASTLSAIIEILDAGLKVHLVGGTEELRRLLNGVVKLRPGNPTDVPELFGFKDWKEVLVHVKNEDSHELQMFVSLVESRGEKQLLWALSQCTETEDDADIAVSTAHKAKGRQWSRVRIFDDFFNSKATTGDDVGNSQSAKLAWEAEIRLLYVALTRAKDALEVPDSMLHLLKHGKLKAKTKTQVSEQQRLL